MSTPRPLPILLGYRPRQPWVVEPGFSVPGVGFVSSASDCITGRVVSSAPEWDEINGAFHYASVEDAQAAASRASVADCEIHATLLFPLVFDGTKVDPVRVRLKSPTSGHISDRVSPPPFESLGLDVVALGHPSSDHMRGEMEWISFGCAPLSCNGLSAEHPVNRWCLLNEWDEAVRAARRFAVEEPEPGPFVIVEVRRVAQPARGIAKDDQAM